MTAAQMPPPRRSSTAEAFLRSILLSTPAMAFKRSWRDGVWAWRSRRLRNPPLPERPKSILFLCLGNICRSPFAAHRAVQLFGEAGLGHIRCSSAGFRTSQAATSPPEAASAASAYGVSLDGHRPVALTPEMIAMSDMIVVMEPSQIDALRSRWPAHEHRIYLLPLFDSGEDVGPFERCHLVDPFGKQAAEFDRCYRRIDRALRQMLNLWQSGVATRQASR